MKKISSKVLLNLELENQVPLEYDSQVLLALDYGEKFCGLAWSPDGFMIFPIGIFETEKIIGEIQKIIIDKNISKLILGLPISADGGENMVCLEIRKIEKKLKPLLPIETVNERFSSQKVIHSHQGRIDDLAAAHILEFYLSQKIK